MMGSAEALPEAPQKATVFMEDMSEDQLASAVSYTGFERFLIKREFKLINLF